MDNPWPPSRILVPVDFGDASARAVRVAGDLAARTGARLTALHAESIEAPPYFTHEQLGALERQRQAARAGARRYLADFAARLTPAPVEAAVTDGPPADAVLAAARPSDLVVMGTHGRRGPARWWLGSVAERVVREAEAPVLVVRAAGGEAPARAEFQRLLVVASNDPAGAVARRYAGQLAALFGGTILDELTMCRASDAAARGATLLVVAKPTRTASWMGEAPERLIRECTLPMVFVPSEGGPAAVPRA